MIAKIVTALLFIPTAYFCVFGNNPWINAILLAASGFSLMCWDESFYKNEKPRG